MPTVKETSSTTEWKRSKLDQKLSEPSTSVITYNITAYYFDSGKEEFKGLRFYELVAKLNELCDDTQWDHIYVETNAV